MRFSLKTTTTMMAFSVSLASSRSTAAAAALLGTRARCPSAFAASFVARSSRSQSSFSAFRRSSGVAFRRYDDGSVSRAAIRSSSSSVFRMSSSSSAASSAESSASSTTATKKPVPTILLAGFLGSGKTTTLKHLLENKSGIKIGTVVNDVAAVNIDAKLIANSGSASSSVAGTTAEAVVELQNGCACCSLADELLTSVERLTDNGKRELDAIVVELSGIADPTAVRDNWLQAELMGHPATKLASLDRTVTLIDACTFGTDWMTWDAAGDRDDWTEDGDDCAAARKVPELLAEQVEAADLLVVNKIDLAGPEQAGVASGVARALNDAAKIAEVEFGRVSVEELLGLGEKKDEEEDRGHAHEHGHSDTDHDCGGASDCDDPSHDHGHSETDHVCDDSATCDDPSHDHSHDRASSAEASSSCAEPECTDPTHSHSHSHDHAEDDADCADPECTDASHDHSHDRAPSPSSSSTAADRLGIGSFVYRTPAPFDSRRLLSLLNKWPVPIKDTLDLGLLKSSAQSGGTSPVMDSETGEVENSPFAGVLRSKGFCWMAPTKWTGTTGADAWRHDTAMYWSHAGKHFGITSAGKWWGTISKEKMEGMFADNPSELDRIMKEDWLSEEWGDRRQELVFIGTGLNEEMIREALDACLCTEEEMGSYRGQVRNLIDAAFNAEKKDGGPSLFDVGGSDHIDEK